MARTPLPSHDLPLLDGLRAVAALMVLTTHVGFQTGATLHGSWVGAAVARFDLGVPLFFALSGFLLVRPWLAAATEGRPLPSSRRYLSRRAVRILPAYWVVLAVALATTAAGVGLRVALSHAFLLQIYGGVPIPDLTQTWSLCTEVAFYLVLPLVAPAVARRSVTGPGRRVVTGWLAAATLLAWTWTGLAAAGVLPVHTNTWLPPHLDWFAVGMALALTRQYVVSHPGSRVTRVAADLGARPGSTVLLAGALFWLACTPLAGPLTLEPATPAEAVIKEALYAAVAGLLLVAAGAADQRRGAAADVLGNRPVQAAGRVSYGVFLWHLLVLAAVDAVLHLAPFTGGFWPVLVLTLGGTLAVASLSWVVLEAPLLRRVHRRPLSQPSSSAAAATVARP